MVVGCEGRSQDDAEPAKDFVGVTNERARSCRWSEELGVASAPLPAVAPEDL